MSTPTPRLTRCESCTRVFDTQAYNTGAQFSCHCGVTVTVRDIKAHDSPVIRCSSCGGSRAPDAKACTFCGASFTLRDRQLSGICASCGTRSSRGETYCHGCGEVLVDSAQAAMPGDKSCPVCAEKHALTHRQLHTVGLLECTHCGGVWLDRQAFAVLAGNAREEARRNGAVNPRHPVQAMPQQPGPAYRRCVECDTVMQRKNYGRKSGIIVDICPKHGTWFDLHELEGVLAWLRSGGVEVADPKPVPQTPTQMSNFASTPAANVSSTRFDDAFDIADVVFDLIGSFFRH